jgi:hypothetical protein
LYFAPERQGQGAFREILLLRADRVPLGLQNEVAVLGAAIFGVLSRVVLRALAVFVILGILCNGAVQEAGFGGIGNWGKWFGLLE